MSKVGKKLGRLLVIRDSGQRKHRAVVYECSCDCGNITYKRSDYLLRNKDLSCGCMFRDYQKQTSGNSHLNTIYYVYKKNARNRNLEFFLTKDEFKSIITRDCHYCGAGPEVRYDRHGSNGKIKMTGADRWDNKIGYTTSNCVPCCKQCNIAKGTLTPKQFLDWLLRAAGKFGSVNAGS